MIFDYVYGTVSYTRIREMATFNKVEILFVLCDLENDKLQVTIRLGYFNDPNYEWQESPISLLISPTPTLDFTDLNVLVPYIKAELDKIKP